MPLSLSVSQLVLRAKQLELEAVRHVAGRIELADVAGKLIHALQRERGATSVYLASGGQRFGDER
ncbi:MAG: antitermination regulator, partial [Rubrivivax sp.]